MSASDPSNYVTNPPSVVVKVTNTTRDDMNGKLGIVVGYQQDRQRYLIHITDSSQSTMALKPENITKASTLESYQAQYQQLRNDPRIARQIHDAYEKLKTKLHPLKPEYAGVLLLILVVSCMYYVGFTKTLMLVSSLFLLGVLIAPDLMNGGDVKTIVRNFPTRCRENIEQNVPFLRGKLTNTMAAGIVVLMLVVTARSLFVTSGSAGTTSPRSPSKTTAGSSFSPQHYYKLGWEDATQELEFGASLTESAKPHGVDRDLGVGGRADEWDDLDFAAAPPPPEQPRSKFGFGSIMSAWFLFRTAKELGTDAANGGRWDYQLALANLRTLEPWKLAFMAFSVYNLVKTFV